MEAGFFLFPEFETLDAAGPIEILKMQPEYKLRYLSMGGGPITSAQGMTVMTENLDHFTGGILLIPGGMGTRTLVKDGSATGRLKEAAELSEWCLTVCTGSALLAQTGLLDGRRATSNKMAFEWVTGTRPQVHWIRHARWVTDGKFYTSSGVSAGIDMALGFMADRFGTAFSEAAARHIEYLWNRNPGTDPFSESGREHKNE